ncbi:MAG: thioredoxin family protein [Candidatus Caenarcaniphilales bacterium]|nr:thioredoxin family protein [Candidatus Caenarcaniphilales bacterium]
MKEIFKKNILLSLLFSFALFGCGNKEATTTDGDSETGGAVSFVSKSLPDAAKKSAEEYIIKGTSTVFFFYADWCPACRAFKPTLEEVEANFSNVKVLRMNVDEQKDLTKSFSVTSIPTLFFFDKNGEFVESTTGGLANDVLTKQFEKITQDSQNVSIGEDTNKESVEGTKDKK